MLRRLVVVLHWPAFLWSCFLIGVMTWARVQEGESFTSTMNYMGFWFVLSIPTFIYYSGLRYVLLNEWVWFPWNKMR